MVLAIIGHFELLLEKFKLSWKTKFLFSKKIEIFRKIIKILKIFSKKI